MPKKQIDFPPGSPTPDDWRDFLILYFGQRAVERLEHLGGRLMISLTVPFNPKDRRVESPIVNDEEVSNIRALRVSNDALRKRLDSYDVKSLRALCDRLGIVVSKKVPRIELISEITRSLRGEAMWEGISRSTTEP